MHLLFVYGSLKRGFSNDHFLEGQKFVAEVVTQPIYRMYDYGGFPAAVLAKEDGASITGELWEIDDACLNRVDWLEDIDQGLYERTTAQLAHPHDQMAGVIMYHYLRDVSSLPDVGTTWLPEMDTRP